MNIKIGNKEYNINKKVIIISVIILLIVIVAIIFTNSNKSNKLECKNSRSNSTANVEETISGIFEKGKLSKLEFYYKMMPKKEFQYLLDELYDTTKRGLDRLKDDGGYDFTLKKEDNYYSYSAVADINVIPDSSKYAIGYNNSWTYEDVKKDLERNNFKCK